MFNLLLDNNKRAFVSEAPVHLTLILAVAKRQLRIDSIRLGKSYLESIPTSEFGATTDIRQTAGYDIWLAAVLPNSAKTGHTSDAENHSVARFLYIPVLPEFAIHAYLISRFCIVNPKFALIQLPVIHEVFNFYLFVLSKQFKTPFWLCSVISHRKPKTCHYIVFLKYRLQ